MSIFDRLFLFGLGCWAYGLVCGAVVIATWNERHQR